MDGIGFIFESAKKVGLNEEEIMTQVTNYRAKEGLWAKQFIWVSCSQQCDGNRFLHTQHWPK